MEESAPVNESLTALGGWLGGDWWVGDVAESYRHRPHHILLWLVGVREILPSIQEEIRESD